MKKVLVMVGLLALSSAAFGQGAINFLTYNTTQNVLGRAYVGSVAGGVFAGTTYSGQLYVNTGASIDAAGTGAYAGTPKAFLASGVISGGAVSVNGTSSGQQVWVQVRAWLTSAGASYDAALAAGGAVGVSNAIQIGLGGGTLPPSYLTGLQPFAIVAVPEPSTIALGLLGLGALMIRRRK